jgi:hypothetical protein
MKHFLIKALACAAVILPLTASAADFGDFKVGQKFKLTVTQVKSTVKTGYFGVESKVPIPSSVPKFKKKAKVAFSISKGGKLTAKGLNIPFSHGDAVANEYNFYKEGTPSVTHNAEITKDSNKKPTGGTLSFFINDYSGPEPIFRTVIYELD